MTKVAIASPTLGFVDSRTWQSGILMANQAGLAGIDVGMGITSRMTVQTARNWLEEGFMQTDCEWCFWIDSDMTWPSDALVTLMQRAKQLDAYFVSGLYVQRHGSHKPLIWRRDERIEGPDGQVIVRKYPDEYVHHHVVPTTKNPFKVHAVGFGCVLVHRKVIAAMEKPLFKFVALENGGEASEDFYFCVQARKLGFDLWLIPEVSCGHIGEAPIYTIDDFKMGDEDLYKIEIPGAKPRGSAA